MLLSANKAEILVAVTKVTKEQMNSDIELKSKL